MRRAVACVALLVLAGWLPRLTTLARQSTDLEMDRVSVTGAAARLVSPGFENLVVVGQNSPFGAASACNTGFVNSLGALSIHGDLPVPILLRVDRHPASPLHMQLSWSGADDAFQVYRAFIPQDLLDPMNLFLTTNDCTADDTDASASSIVYYTVIAQP